MIVGRGGTTVVSDLPAAHGLAGTAGPQRTIEERGDPGAPSRGHRVTSPGEQAASVLGGSGGVRSTDPVTVPSLPTASDRHPRHNLAVAPGPGEATLDPSPTPPNRRPTHSTRAAPVSPAAGRRELLLGCGCRIGHPRHAAWVYSCISPPSRSRRRRCRSGGDAGGGSGLSGAA
jgi:hypothetical protein